MKLRVMRACVWILVMAMALGAPVSLSAQAGQSAAKNSAESKGVKAKGATAAQTAAAKDPLAGFDEFAEAARKDWKVPGFAVAIVKDGAVIYSKGFGLRNVKESLPATPDTLFAIGSCSKAFTAAALGLLVDDGKLEWDKPLRNYLPAFKMHDDYATEHMTPRDLVTHRSGLPRHDLLWYGSNYTRKEMFERLRYLEPSRGFRANYQYQNLMFMTAGLLVEEISGGAWEQFIQKRFFEPLQMTNSNFSVSASQKTADFALPYQEEKDEVKQVPFRNIDQIGPAGSINSSVNQMANWVRMQMNKGKFGEKQIISENSLRETQTPQIVSGTTMRWDEVSYSMYAMGWGVVMYRGHVMLTHGGGIDGFTAHVSLLPRDKLGVVILTNRGGTPLPGLLAYNIYDRLLGMSEVPWNQRAKDDVARSKENAEKAAKENNANRKTDTRPSHTLKDYAGRFMHPGYGVVTIEENGDALKASYNGMSSPLRHYHYDVFEGSSDNFERQKFTFVMNSKGNIEEVRVALQPGVSDIAFTRMPETKVDRALLDKLTGEYELAGLVMTIAVRGETTLTANVPGQPEYELEPVHGTEFSFKGLKGFSVEFKLSGDGAAESAVVTQPNGVFTAKRKARAAE